MQVRLADVLVNAVDAAFQYRKETFYSIGMNVVSDIFLGGMVHSLMAGELLADSPINVALVSPKVRSFIDSRFQDRTNLVGGDGWHMARTNLAPRSTKATTACFGAGSRYARFRAFPPTKVSSPSTTFSAPPSGEVSLSPMHARIRCMRNQAVFMLQLNAR